MCLKATTQSEPEHVCVGAHHTLVLEKNQNFSIEKESWAQVVFLERLENAATPEQQQAKLAVVAMQTGLGHVCLVAGSIAVTKGKIETNIPKELIGSSDHVPNPKQPPNFTMPFINQYCNILIFKR